MNNIEQASQELHNLLTKLISEGKEFHLDDDPTEFNCFATAEEAKELDEKLDRIRGIIGEDALWEIAEKCGWMDWGWRLDNQPS